MTSLPILSRFLLSRCRQGAPKRRGTPDLHTLWLHPETLPRWVRDSPQVQYYLDLLGPLDWPSFPERDLETQRGMPAVPYVPFVAACLVKLDQQLRYFSHLRRYLLDHPALTWLLGFPPASTLGSQRSFEAALSLPSQRHFPRLLRKIPNASLQFLLDDSVRLIRAELQDQAPDFGETIALDTKHILAWVRENNPRTYVKERYDKAQQPSADSDCRLGCKRKRNQRASSQSPPPTPNDDPVPAATIVVGEYYWGYASGIVTTKVPHWGEFVLAELTLPFDRPDVAYFFPLMAATERRLGFRPSFGAFDAAYDAWYVYAHFHHRNQPWQTAFAAVPLMHRRSHSQFSPDGLPLCKAGLPMPLKNKFFSKTASVPHERAYYVCPLRYPDLVADACPINDDHWAKGGCRTALPTSIGTRLRHRIDRQSEVYATVYNQRTATERLFSLAKALGIERPKLRNGQAIANLNTLIYVLLNLRALRRIKQQKTAPNNLH